MLIIPPSKSAAVLREKCCSFEINHRRFGSKTHVN
jgi:hypothetical protein